mgnify:FL=1
MHGVKRYNHSRELLEQKRQQDKQRISDYCTLTKQTLVARDNNVYSTETLELTQKLLSTNPEFNTVWNYRRDILASLHSQGETAFTEDELAFTMTQLKRFPKVYWIWNHRVWVLTQFCHNDSSVWQRELAIVDKLLGMDARNYHGWHYRREVVGQIELIEKRSMDKTELEYVTQVINRDISNYSAWHQRVQLVTRLSAQDLHSLLSTEIDYITNALYTDADDQSVWFYIKWFITNDAVRGALTQEEYTQMLRGLRENVLLINTDDREFSGSDNTWCLKMLIVIERALRDAGDESPQQCDDLAAQYLDKLISADPDRKNRYKHLLGRE